MKVPQLFKYLGFMAVGHLLSMITFAWPFFELTRTGVVSGLAFLALVMGSLLLYVAVFNAAVRNRPAKKSFMGAAVLLAAFFWKWHLAYLVSTVAYGALLAIGGWRLSTMATVEPVGVPPESS